jgi:ornithine carbamoyltransferase
MAALMGADLRLVGPKHYAPPADVLKVANEIAERTGATITVTDDPVTGVEGVDFIHTDVWVSMGEPKEVWSARVRDLTPYQVNADAMARTGNKRAKFMHCLPAFHDTRTTVGSEVAEQTGLTGGLEVTDEVFSSAANIAFDQAENRLHTIKAVMVATIGS